MAVSELKWARAVEAFQRSAMLGEQLSECPTATHRWRGGIPDGMPPEGTATADAAFDLAESGVLDDEFDATVQSVEVRAGQVYRQLGEDVEVVDAAVWTVVAVVPEDRCPEVPQFTSGVPVTFVHQTAEAL